MGYTRHLHILPLPRGGRGTQILHDTSVLLLLELSARQCSRIVVGSFTPQRHRSRSVESSHNTRITDVDHLYVAAHMYTGTAHFSKTVNMLPIKFFSNQDEMHVWRL
jgi:hypothetical protein